MVVVVKQASYQYRFSSPGHRPGQFRLQDAFNSASVVSIQFLLSRQFHFILVVLVRDWLVGFAFPCHFILFLNNLFGYSVPFFTSVTLPLPFSIRCSAALTEKVVLTFAIIFDR
jgi:hypothetical protein